MKLEGKVAIITGGNAGIGQSITLAFVDEGAKVCLCGRNRENLNGVQQEIEEKGGQVIAVETDVGREKDVEDMVARTVAHYGTHSRNHGR